MDPGPPAIGEVGQLVNGEFMQPDWLTIWNARQPEDLLGVDPSVYLYGRIIYPRTGDHGPPEREIIARIVSICADGSFLTPGVLAPFALVSHDRQSAIYHSKKPFLLIQTAEHEGENLELIAVYAEEKKTRIKIVAP